MLSNEQLTTIVAEASAGLHFGPTQAEFAERVRGACEAALEADRAERGKGRPSDDEIKAKWHEIWLGKYLGHGSVECAIDFAHWVADRCQSVSKEEAEPRLDRGPAREEEQAVGHARHAQALIAKWNRRAEGVHEVQERSSRQWQLSQKSSGPNAHGTR